MVSLCVKTNNSNIINYLYCNISKIELDNIIFVKKEFSKYSNIIIHYLGNSIPEFYNELCNVITNCIINTYEPTIIHNLLLLNYFYFDDCDLNMIETNCKDTFRIEKDITISPVKNDIIDRKHYLWAAVLKYISCNKSLFLDGFITFRTSEYINCIDSVVDYCVNQFVINREYHEFINMLKIYISSKPPQCDLVHLIYINEESILLDKNNNIISLTKNNLNVCYLSDITFSSNDYALNSLLSLLPEKIIVHLAGPEDEFIHTLKSIFTDSLQICTNCNICKSYISFHKQQGL